MELHVVLFSTGISSAVVAKMVADQYGKENTVWLLTDTNWEDEDNYRFATEVEQKFGIPALRRSDGRTPAEVWLGRGYLVGPTGAPCTRVLKTEQTLKYIAELKQQGITPVLYFGISVDEEHRTQNMINRYGIGGIECRFPLVDADLTGDAAKRIVTEDWGLTPPRMYSLNFSHANCGGRCVKAGAKHFINLLETWPDRFLELAYIEQQFRLKHLSDTTILRRTVNKQKVKITLFEVMAIWLKQKIAEKKKAETEPLDLELCYEVDTPCECHF